MTRAFFWLLGALLLAGCDGDDPPAPPTELATAPPLPECPDQSYELCDIRDRDCQQRLGSLAACLRDNEPLANLPVDVLSESDFTAMLRSERKEPTAAGIAFRQALAAFGLAPAATPTLDEAAQTDTDNIAGIYLPDEKRIVIVDHGLAANSASSNLTLLHEFIHALQDTEEDLTTWPRDDQPFSLDLMLARDSVVEGEASFYEYRGAVPLLGLDIASADLDAALEGQRNYLVGKAFKSDAPIYLSDLTFPYAYGAVQADAAWDSGGPRGLDPLWASPPQTTQQVMSQVLGLGEPQSSRVELAPPALSNVAGQPDAGLSVSASDTLGAWGLAVLLERVKGNTYDELALTWRGDRLWAVQEPSLNATYALWEWELDSPESAKAVNSVLSGLQRVDHAAKGSRVYLSAASPSNAPRRLTPHGQAWLDSN